MKTALYPENNYIITTEPNDIVMGLFGGITLHIFEILPYLHSQSILPLWNIKSSNYGKHPDFTIIPGVFDLAYTPDLSSAKEIELSTIRRDHVRTLGNDWPYLSKLWSSYFKIPDRIIFEADKLGDLTETLGLHYRGTDKIMANWDTNGITQDEFIILIKDFLKNHKEISTIFIATDEFSFVRKFKEEFPLMKIINLGAVEFHLNPANSPTKADNALLDCLVLSRCKYMINTSSALSAFSKVLNPDLECYRVAASKLFGEMPYFPVAYIPKLTSSDAECQKILDRLFKDDWLQNKNQNKKYNIPFSTRKRSQRAIALWRLRRKYLRLIRRIRNKISHKKS